MTEKLTHTPDYRDFIAELKEKVQAAQRRLNRMSEGSATATDYAQYAKPIERSSAAGIPSRRRGHRR